MASRPYSMAFPEAGGESSDDEAAAEDVGGYMPMTVPSRCQVSGSGLTEATVRQEAFFEITAFDERGKRRDEGGDAFFVNIRGCGVRIRARITDHHDGRYTVRYKPEISGVYAIAISLYGDSLLGSPFMLHAHTQTAVAAQCIVRGDALHTAVARIQQYFEISFRDAGGEIAHAEDLDVYVEFAEEQPDVASAPAPAPAPAPARPETRSASDEDPPARRSRSPKMSRARSAGSGSENPLGAAQTVNKQPTTSLGTMTAHERNFWLKKVPPLQLNKEAKSPRSGRASAPRECVVTSKSPLIVRSDLALDSERLCQLLPGRRIYLLDMRHENTVTRGLAAIDLEDEPEDELITTARLWQETYGSKPPWLSDPPAARNGKSPFLRSPRTRKAPIGWVTVSRDGRGLVTPSCQLAASDRQLHMQAWARRLAIDRSLEFNKSKGSAHMDDSFMGRKKAKDLKKTSLKTAKGIFQNEQSADPTGVGFAFGGVEPGRLHARGRLIEVHKVFYSIGLVGLYRLHVGLRQQQMPLPGSPFKLKVIAGPAHASSTNVPSSVTFPIEGSVGLEEEQGCHLLLPVSDRMGNLCTKGGAKIIGSCTIRDVSSSTEDLDDGTYKLVWRSEQSGTYQVSVTIDGEQIQSSPFMIKLVSDVPDLAKTIASGAGLKEITAGGSGKIQLQMHDKFANVTIAGPSIVFGLTFVHHKEDRSKDKEEVKRMQNKWKTEKSDRFEGQWMSEFYEIVYQPSFAGEQDLYVWCVDKNSSSKERTLLCDSPYRVFCMAGEANAKGSRLEGFHIEEVVVEQTKGKKSDRRESISATESMRMSATDSMRLSATDSMRADSMGRSPVSCGPLQRPGSIVSAGDSMLFRPMICDLYGNPAKAPDGTLLFVVTTPSGDSPIQITRQVKAGLTTYEARFEPTVQGQYSVHCTLAGVPIKGSPMNFFAEPALPDVNKCILSLPEPPLYATYQGQTFTYDVSFKACDRFGNMNHKGGAFVVARLGGNVPQGQEPEIEVRDHGDGTYSMKVECKSPAEIKLIISVSHKSHGPSTEFPPINLNFLNRGAALAKEEREAKRSGGGGAPTTESSAEAKDERKAKQSKEEERKAKQSKEEERKARQSKEDVAGVKDDAVTSEVEVLDHGQAEMELT